MATATEEDFEDFQANSLGTSPMRPLLQLSVEEGGSVMRTKGSVKTTSQNSKIVNDSVYGPIFLPPVIVAFMDTPAFQRLRNIRQLGVASWVYPTASHHRFEHCLGTCHLAGKLMRQIQRSEPELKIDELDVLCAQVAGLLHDIGRGPFSDVWDEVLSNLDINYERKQGSIDIIDWMLRNDSKLRQKLEKENFDDKCIRVVKEMIYGILPGNDYKEYMADHPKSFIYDVVTNEFCGLDVSTLDYLARDGRALGTVTLTTGDLERLMLTATVGKDKKDYCYHIYWRDVAFFSVNNVFQLRHHLHFIAYLHKTVISVQLMLVEALGKAKDYLKLSEVYEINEKTVNLNVDKFLRLTDAVYWKILHAEESERNYPEGSQRLLQRITERNIYPPLSTVRIENPSLSKSESAKFVEDELRKLIKNDQKLSDSMKKECEEAMIVTKCEFDYGKGNKNPLDVLVFKRRSGALVGRRKNIYGPHMFSPKHNQENEFRLYSRKEKDPQKEDQCNIELKCFFDQWAKGNERKSLDY